MKKTFVTLGLCLLAISPMWGQGLKDVVGKYFLIGTALNSSHINGTNTKEVELVKEQFNAIVAENCMKPESLSPSEGVWNWDEADKFVQFGIDNNITVTGHTLLWHSQAARWMSVVRLQRRASRARSKSSLELRTYFSARINRSGLSRTQRYRLERRPLKSL